MHAGALLGETDHWGMLSCYAVVLPMPQPPRPHQEGGGHVHAVQVGGVGGHVGGDGGAHGGQAHQRVEGGNLGWATMEWIAEDTSAEHQVNERRRLLSLMLMLTHALQCIKGGQAAAAPLLTICGRSVMAIFLAMVAPMAPPMPREPRICVAGGPGARQEGEVGARRGKGPGQYRVLVNQWHRLELPSRCAASYGQGWSVWEHALPTQLAEPQVSATESAAPARTWASTMGSPLVWDTAPSVAARPVPTPIRPRALPAQWGRGVGK